MSVHYDGPDRWIVRWRENGRQRARRFDTEAEALELETALNPPQPPPEARGLRHADIGPTPSDRTGVYAYETTEGRSARGR
jgi:hypothetical protein